MELQFFGANCLKVSAKKAVVVVDDNLDLLGSKNITKESDIALFSAGNVPQTAVAKLNLAEPGEYEIADISIQGITANSLNGQEKTNTIFKISCEDITLVITGNISPDLTDSQLEALGTVDILFVPVGGGENVLDAGGALKLIKSIEPKIVIPSFYDDGKLKYPTALGNLESAIKDLAMEPTETTAKLKIKPGEVQEGTRLIVLEQQ